MLTPGNCSTIGGQIGGIHGQNHQYQGAAALNPNFGLSVPQVAPAIDRIGVAFNEAVYLAERVIRLADRLAGPVPVPACGNVKTSPTGVIPELVDRAETTMSGIGDANAALAQLEALFGL